MIMAMTKIVHIINGPNLNLLGQREPELYGRETLADVKKQCRAAAKGLELSFMQSNSEAQIIDWIHAARGKAKAIIINPGALSHTSIAIYDALAAFEGKVFEVHISNIHKREEFRHHSYVSKRADGIIVGCGVQGYSLAVQRAAQVLG
jgi:3-dehydroquinate dehydratase II